MLRGARDRRRKPDPGISPSLVFSCSYFRMAAIISFTTPRRAAKKVKMAVTIFGSGCLCGHRLRGSFKLATPYVVANQARVTFAGRSEPGPRRTTTSGIRDALRSPITIVAASACALVRPITISKRRRLSSDRPEATLSMP